VSDLAPFLVVGVVAGSLYGLAGMGLVLTYQTSGILNFAHGAVAAAGAFAFYDLHFRHGLPWPLALLVSVVGIGVVAGTALERLARRLAGARPVLAVTATIGGSRGCSPPATGWRPGPSRRSCPPPASAWPG
jgi:branched-subunit amino acid ABC-type transport system permease component